MINDIERKQIDYVPYEEDLCKCADIAKRSINPFFLFEYAHSYNWSDGFDIAKAIANNTHCDLGTALSLFWLTEGMCYFIGEVKRDEYNSEWADFCDLLIKRLTENYYSLGPISFKPSINKITIYKYKKSGVPPVLYQEVLGKSC